MYKKGVNKNKGMTLVELLIASVIGLIALIVISNIFIMSKKSSSLSEGMGRVHENKIIGLDFLQDDLRMIGHFGCVSDQALEGSGPLSYLSTTLDTTRTPLNFHMSILGYEATGTSPGNTIDVSSLPTGGTGFSPALPDDLLDILNDRVNTSDIIGIRYLNPRSINMIATNNNPYPDFKYNANDWGIIGDFDNNNGLLAVSDCSSTTIFQASEDPSNGEIVVSERGLNIRPFTQVYENNKAKIYGVTSVIYYVGKPEGTEYPSLFRVRFGSVANGALTFQKDELVRGVETMQILYGQDHSTGDRLTGFIDRQRNASETNSRMASANESWRRVGMVKVGILMIDPNSSSALQRGGAALSESGQINIQGVNVIVPADQKYRAPIETTVAIRNRLYGN